jgi:hypothetical protein
MTSGVRTDNETSYSLIRLGYTTIATLAVFASERRTHDTSRAIMILVKLPKAQKLIHHSLLLAEATGFGNIARVIHHTKKVEIGAESP